MAEQTDAAALSGPEALTCSARSLAGPFARAGATLKLPSLDVTVTNTGATPCTIARLACDPPRDAERGMPRDGGLHAAVADAAAPTIGPVVAPGASLTLALHGRIPARPGSYATTLRVATDSGQTLAIPLAITVAASPLWGVALMLLGLAAIGLVNALNGESDVDRTLRDVLQLRQTIHEQLDQTPPPVSQAPEVARLDRDLDDAIVILHAPRGASVRDWRVADAGEQVAAAKARWDTLQKAIGNGPPGTAEVAELQGAWDTLRTLADEKPPPAPAVSGILAPRLVAFLDRLRGALYAGPAQAALADLAPQVARARLRQAAGEQEAGRQSAIAAHRAVMRTASFVEARLATVQQFGVLAAGLWASDQLARLQAASLPDADRAEILAALDAAAASLGDDATLADFAKAGAAIEDTRTRALRLAANDMVTRVNAAVARVRATFAMDPVDRVLEGLRAVPSPSVQQKRAGLQQIIEAWRGLIATVPEPAERDALVRKADAVATALAGPDLAATSPPYRALVDAWTDYSARRQIDAVRAITLPFCRGQRDAVLKDLTLVAGRLGTLQARPELAQWEQQLDRIRLAALRLPLEDGSPDACIGAVGDLSGQTIALSAEMFRTVLSDVPIPLDAKLDAARRSGDAATIAAVEALVRAPRPLTITVGTPAPDRYAGRAITFGIGDLDPVWGPGVDMTLTFGDDSPPFRANAEQVQRGQVIEHVYTAPVTARLHATATETAAGPALGEAETTLLIAPSPLSAARRLADQFLNARFALALAIAGLVYFWRFHAGRKVFGAAGIDYVEAFALGVAMDAIVSRLPELLTKAAGG